MSSWPRHQLEVLARQSNDYPDCLRRRSSTRSAQVSLRASRVRAATSLALHFCVLARWEVAGAAQASSRPASRGPCSCSIRNARFSIRCIPGRGRRAGGGGVERIRVRDLARTRSRHSQFARAPGWRVDLSADIFRGQRKHIVGWRPVTGRPPSMHFRCSPPTAA